MKDSRRTYLPPAIKVISLAACTPILWASFNFGNEDPVPGDPIGGDE